MKIAILDYDNTLSDGYSRYKLGFAMEEAGLVKKGLKEEIEDLEGRYLSGEIDYNTKFAQDKLIFSKYHEGVRRLDAVRFLEQDFDLRESIYPWVEEFLEKLDEEGFLTVIISGAWDFIMEQAQYYLDFDSFFATEIMVENEKFTNDYKVIMDYKTKEEITAKVLTDSIKSIGMGDSVADFSFLDKVDKGILFSPKEDARKASEKKDFIITNGDHIMNDIELVISEL